MVARAILSPNFYLFYPKRYIFNQIPTQTCNICKGVWNLPHQVYIYLIFKVSLFYDLSFEVTYYSQMDLKYQHKTYL